MEKAIQLVAKEIDAVETIMLEQFQFQSFPAIELVGKHIIQNGGKRLRPTLLLLANRACGDNSENATYLAAVVELMHTATLLHDDVIDLSPLRRKQLTAHEIWGNRTSILVGDFMFTRSLELSARYANNNWNIISILANTLNQITVGEIIQLQNHFNPDLDEATYIKIIANKTAVLFQASTEIGARLSEHAAYLDGLKIYGHHLGIAFQLMDDLLDYESDTEMLGKSIGDDLAEGKATLPFIYALAKSPEQQLLITALKEGKRDALNEIVNIMQDVGAFAYTRKVAHSHVEQALSGLDLLPESEYKAALIRIAHFAIERGH